MNDYWNTTREKLLAYAGTMDQIAPVRRFIFCEGRAKSVEAIEVQTGSGLALTFLADRGLDLFDMRWRGRPLAWHSAAGVVSPVYYERRGSGWLRGFGGGMVVTCGLRNVGPGLEEGWETFGLHGEISYTPASRVHMNTGWENGRYAIGVSGQLREAYPFGPNLVVRRTWRTELGAAWVELEDVVTNEGFQPEIHMQLYHCNFGYPLLNENAHLYLSTNSVAPRDEAAGRGIDRWSRFEAPLDDAAEQVFFHSFTGLSPATTTALLAEAEGGDFAARVSWPSAELPYLVQWKLCRKGEYVLGIEPANCLVEGRQWHRRESRPMLAPGASTRMSLRFEVLNSAEAVSKAMLEMQPS